MRKVAVALVIFAGIFSSCKSFDINRKPEAVIERFDIDSISLRDITFAFDVGINNPYPVGLKLEDIRMKFSVENRQFFQTSTGKGVRIKANGKSVSEFKVSLKYVDIIKIVKDYASKDRLDCAIDLEIVIPLPEIAQKAGFGKSVTFKNHVNKKIPAIKPSVSIANFRVEKPSLDQIEKSLISAKKSVSKEKVYGMFNDMLSGKKSEQVINPADLDLKLRVNFDIELKNSTTAKLLFNNLNYDFAVNSSSLVEGKTENVKFSGGKYILTVASEFSSKALGKSVVTALTDRKGKFTLKGHTFVKFPDEIKKEPLKLTFDENGDLGIK